MPKQLILQEGVRTRTEGVSYLLGFDSNKPARVDHMCCVDATSYSTACFAMGKDKVAYLIHDINGYRGVTIPGIVVSSVYTTKHGVFAVDVEPISDPEIRERVAKKVRSLFKQLSVDKQVGADRVSFW